MESTSFDDAAELGALTDWGIEQHAAFAKRLLKGIDQGIEMNVIRIHLVDNEHASEAASPGFAEHSPGVHLDSVGRRDDDNGRFYRLESFDRAADEIRIAGGVQGVHLLPLMLQMQNGGVDREATFLLLVVIIGKAAAVVYAAATLHGLALEEKGIGQRSFPGRSMSHQRDVANIFDAILGHESYPFCHLAAGIVPRGASSAAKCRVKPIKHNL